MTVAPMLGAVNADTGSGTGTSADNADVECVYANGMLSHKVSEWEQWNDADSEDAAILTQAEMGTMATDGWACGSTFHCYNPYIYDGDTLQKGYWMSNTKPVKCVWEYYDPNNIRFYKVDSDVDILEEGSFGDEGYRYAFADKHDFTVPALFLEERFGDWKVRSYFVFENGRQGSEGPVVTTDGQSMMLSFPVTKGTWVDQYITAPVYLLNHETVPVIWWLSPVWIIGLFFAAMVVWTKSVTGAVTVIGNAIEKTKEAKRKWDRQH